MSSGTGPGTAITEVHHPHGGGAASLPVEERPFKPVKAWALIGGICLALQLYVFTAWVISGSAHRTPDGPSEIPGWMVIGIRTFELVGLLFALVIIYIFLLRPWKRAGHLTVDGMFVIGFIATYWQDPLFNWIQPWATFNTHTLLQFGSWGPQIPGWFSPRGNLLAEPLTVAPPAYVSMFGACVFANWAMRRAKLRWPSLGRFGLVAFCFGFLLVVDLVAELFMIRLGIYSYPGAIRGLTFNYGKYYQFPVYQAVMATGLFTAWASVRYFRNDQGQTMAERGIEKVRAGRKARSCVRLLAHIGVCNVIFTVFFVIPSQFFALHADSWPEDIVNRSYLTDGLCGTGTPYACPGPDVPVPRPRSAHLGPDGELVPAPN